MSAPSIRFHGRILDAQDHPVGTCFQVAPGVLVTALHVVDDASQDQPERIVRFEPLAGRAGEDRAEARLIASDVEHDLAILTTDGQLPVSASYVAYSDDQVSNTRFTLTGYAMLPEGTGYASYREMPTAGRWEGTATDETGVKLGWARADGVQQGMSGAPVLRHGDGAVIGVLTDRYNSQGVWSSGRIKISRIESMLALLGKRATLAVESSVVRDLKVQNRLSESTINREGRRTDQTFVPPPRWEQRCNEARDAFERGDIVVILAAPGVGSTTFAEQLLAHEAPMGMQLTTFEPGDWDGPTTTVLRPRPWYAHILDLRDPDTDRLSPQFLGGLTQLADCYRDMQARLVLTVRADLWRAVAGQPIAGIHVLRLDEAPDSLSLVERRIKQSAAALVPHLNDPKVKPHLQELSAVQAAEAAQTILHEWALLSVEEDEAEWCDHLAKVLDNHTGELNGLFVPSGTPSQAELLSKDDRCLIIALGCLRSVQLAELDSVSKSLSAYLQRIPQPRDDGKVSAYEALGGPGLRGRIDRIKARVRPGEIVAFKQSAFGDAAVRYVWDNYPTSRPPITEWLIRLAVKDAGRQQVAKEWLSELVRRHQDVDFIKKKMQRLAIEQDCPWLLADVLYDGAKDPHMRRRCERVLYDWSLNDELQGVVVAVAERLLLDGERSEIAVRRLQRVADETSKEEISASVLAAFEAALQHPGARPQLIASAAAWLKQDASKPSAKLALRALVSADAGSLPWLLSEQAAELDLQLVLGEALADDITHDAIVTILAKASLDDTHYARVVDAVAAAAVQQGAGMALYRLLARLGSQDRFSGRDPEGDIQSKVKLVAARDTAPPEALTVI